MANELTHDFPLWRPPSEGRNLIIQATLGCSFNQCRFCSMYKEKAYHARPLEEVFEDIRQAGRWQPQAARVFLADGDAYGLPTDHLAQICAALRATFPLLERISAYATPFNILKKTPDEIMRLRELGLRLIYVGIESGSDRVLHAIGKGKSEIMAKALARADEAGLDISATVILGLGGSRFWEEHIDQTAELVSRHPPKYLSCLQLQLDEGIEPRFMERFLASSGDEFKWQDDLGVLHELRRLIEKLHPKREVTFRSNHASNALALSGELAHDRERLLSEIDRAIAGVKGLRPKWMRGL